MFTKDIIQSKAFKEGSVTGLLLVILLNFISYLKNVCSVNIIDCGWSFGFPAHLYAEGGFISFKEIIWFGSIIDTLSAITLSLLTGAFFKFLSDNKIKPLR